MNFEIAAVITSGPMENTYLGSIEWGWQSDAAGNVTLNPFVALASGAPTAAFMQAAGQWNASIFHDDSFWGTILGTTVETVDLPITTLPSGVKAAVDMTTAEILARVPVVQGEIRGLGGGPSVDRTNKEFEMRALSRSSESGSSSSTSNATRSPTRAAPRSRRRTRSGWR